MGWGGAWWGAVRFLKEMVRRHIEPQGERFCQRNFHLENPLLGVNNKTVASSLILASSLSSGNSEGFLSDSFCAYQVENRTEVVPTPESLVAVKTVLCNCRFVICLDEILVCT